MSNIGDNSSVKAFITRIDKIEDEISLLREDEKSVYTEAKAAGHNVAAMKQALKLYRMNAEKKAKHDAIQETLDSYLSALGLLADTPLGQAAVEREFG